MRKLKIYIFRENIEQEYIFRHIARKENYKRNSIATNHL